MRNIDYSLKEKLIEYFKDTLFDNIISKYNRLYDNRKIIISKAIKYISIFLVVLTAINFLVTYFEYDLVIDGTTYTWENTEQFIIDIYKRIVFIVPGVFVIFWLIHFFIGKRFYFNKIAKDTGLFFFTYIRGTTSVFAKRGGYKDTLMTGLVVMIAKLMRKFMRRTLIKLKKKLYKFDIDNLINVIETNTYIFEEASDKIRQENLLKIFKDNEFKIIKNRYRQNKYKEKDSLTYKSLIEDFELYQISHNSSKYVFDNGLKKEHILNYLYEFSYLYYRLYVIETLIMSNQPMIDDLNKPAFIYSDRNTELVHEIKKVGSDKYKPIPKCLLENYMAINQTEMDIIAGNYKPEVVNEIKKTGKRDYEAIRRHQTGDLFFLFKNGQIEGRGAKVLREMDDWVMKIINGEVVEGGNIIAKVYQFVYNRLESLIKYLDKDKQIKRYKRKIEKFSSKISTSKGLYKKYFENRIKRMNKKIKKYNKKFRLNTLCKIEQLQESVSSKIEKALNNGWVVLNVQLKNPNHSGEFVEINTSRALQKPSLMCDGFSTQLVVKMYDSWKHYNTKYLKPAGENKRVQSEECLADNKRWHETLQMNIKDVIELDNSVMDSIMGITWEMIKDKRYKKIEKASNNKEDEKEEKTTSSTSSSSRKLVALDLEKEKEKYKK